MTEYASEKPDPDAVAEFWAAWDEANPDAVTPAAPEQAPQSGSESYWQVRDRTIGSEEQRPQRDWSRRERKAKPVPDPAKTVVNGLTGEKHVVAATLQGAPTAPRKRTHKPWRCSVCLRNLARQEVQELRQLQKREKLKGSFEDIIRLRHKHDSERQIARRSESTGNGKMPLDLNSKGKRRKPRKQNWRFQGMAGAPPRIGPK